MLRLLPLLLLLGPLQEGGRTPQDQGTWIGPIHEMDPETREVRGEFSGLGKIDYEKGVALLRRVRVTFYTKPTDTEPSHTVHLFATRCDIEGINRAAVFRFSEGLRVFLDQEVRLWTDEGTFDLQKQVLKCPKMTRVVKFTWPPAIDLASALVFMDPVDMGWLRMVGAPEPVFEFAGEEFEFDASSNSFSTGRNGRIRVKGNPRDTFQPGGKTSKPVSNEPTELRSEGPIRLRNLGAAEGGGWTTFHVTAEKNVVVERRAKDATLRIHSDSASIYIASPPRGKNEKGDPKVLSAVFKDRVRIEEPAGGYSATADQLEWNHQDSLLRLTGAPLVEVIQGVQKLRSREVIIDQTMRTVDFKGDIEATFLADTEGRAADKESETLTLTPGDLRLYTNASGRPYRVHASNGVRLSSRRGTPGDDAIEAHGTDFEWNFATGDGSLRGAPFARIIQGPNFVLAPLVTFRGETVKNSLMVIKGPKLLKFFADIHRPVNPTGPALDAAFGLPGLREDIEEPTLNTSASIHEAAFGLPGFHRIPGRRESVMDLVVTCDGDAVLDQKVGLVKLVDRCSVRSQDSTLFADRLFVYLNKEQMSLDRLTGFGRVRAQYNHGPGKTPIDVDGESLQMSMGQGKRAGGRRVVTVVGHPTGTARLGSTWARFRKMTYDLSDQSIELEGKSVISADMQMGTSQE